VTDAAAREAEKVKDSGPLRLSARVGYAVNGLVHALIGAIAISIALGAGGEADQSGALRQLANTPAGIVLLWIVVVGLVALALWQVLHALLSRGADAKRRWARRLGEFGKAAAYLIVAAPAFAFATGSSSNSASDSQTFSARMLSFSGGVFILFAVGLLVLAVGVAFVVRGLLRSFLDSIRLPAGGLGTAVTILGVVGYVAKGVALLVVGVLFCAAALTFDPTKASGLDGALKALIALPFGTVILFLVGAGLIAYGVYCGFRARLARL
jgi:hypothetical protein